MNNKLMFVLCWKCGHDMNQTKLCSHSDEERALIGCWVIDEVIKALQKGYQILEKIEIWRYTVEQYDPVLNKGGLFVEMMDRFLKIKQESSGWPQDCQSKEEKNKYIQDFFDREGIELEEAKIENNPGLRSLAKLILNSFWGKFGEMERKGKTKIVREPKEFFEMVTNSFIDINSIVPINDTVLIISYFEREDNYEPLVTVNVVIAAFVTAQARLKLYSYLELLNERVLYYDTDSILFSHKQGEIEPLTGKFIGDLTDELEAYGLGSYITEFASGGPKNYAYKVFSTAEQTEKIVCKVKGIRLCHQTSKLVNFETIKTMIIKESEVNSITIISSNIKRTEAHELVTKHETKQYKINSTKRKFLGNFDSVPFGYKIAKR